MDVRDSVRMGVLALAIGVLGFVGSWSVWHVVLDHAQIHVDHGVLMQVVEIINRAQGQQQGAPMSSEPEKKK